MKIFSSFTLCLVALLLLPSQSFIDAQTTLSGSAQISAIQAIIDTLQGFLSNTTTCVGTLTSIITYLTGALLNPPNPTVGALLTTLLGNVQGLVLAILSPGCLSNLRNFLNGTIVALQNEINNLQSTTTKPSTAPPSSSSPTTTKPPTTSTQPPPQTTTVKPETTPTQPPPQTTTVTPETTPTQPPQTTQGAETTIKVTSTAQPTTQQVTTKESTTAAPVPTCAFDGSYGWGYWNGICYGEVQVEGTIGNMIETCLTTGIPDVQPASIHSQEQFNFIQEWVLQAPPDWIGLRYDAEGNLKWFDGSPVDFVRLPLNADQNPSLAGYGILDDWTVGDPNITFPYALCQAPPIYG